jgi:alanine dehydrogenase
MTFKSIAFAKELHRGENRVMLCPKDVRRYIDQGFEVLVEQNAGVGAGFANSEYAEAGAKVVSREECWRSSYVVKYKCPTPEEYRFFHSKLTLAASFHAEGNEPLVRALCENNVTSYSMEYFVTPEQVRPIPFSDMEITGKLAFIFGAYHLQTHFGGSGVLLAHVVGARQPKVLVIGYGNVGGAAARAAAAMGCKVTVLGTNQTQLRKFEATVPQMVTCKINSPEVLREELKDSDLVIGAILIATDEMPAMIDSDHLKLMRKGSMIMDITCGSGNGKGWMPTFTHTGTHETPIYLVDGILHCKIDRIPSKVPVTASEAKSENVVSYLVSLGNSIFGGPNDELAETGKLTKNGRLLNSYVIDSLENLLDESGHLLPLKKSA